MIVPRSMSRVTSSKCYRWCSEHISSMMLAVIGSATPVLLCWMYFKYDYSQTRRQNLSAFVHFIATQYGEKVLNIKLESSKGQDKTHTNHANHTRARHAISAIRNKCRCCRCHRIIIPISTAVLVVIAILCRKTSMVPLSSESTRTNTSTPLSAKSTHARFSLSLSLSL